MKIAIFTNNYLPNIYGVTTSIESFRREFEKRGHQVYIFAPKNKDYRDENKNVSRYPSVDIDYKIHFPLPIPHSVEIEKKLKDLEIDIIHSQHPNLLGSVARRWAEKKNVPLVFTWHTIYDQYTHYAPLVPQKISSRWVINNSVHYANQADAVIIPTNSVKKIIKNWGVENPKIYSVATGVDEDNFQNPNGNLIREKLKISKDKKIILSISRLTEEKNVIFLLKEIGKVLEKNQGWVFVMAGEGYLMDELKKIAKEMKLEERIYFPGLVEKDDIKNYMDAADVFVYASKSETQGTIITEAMYMGLPIVAIKSLGIGDLIEDGKNGLLADEDENNFSEKTEEILADEKLRRKIGENAGMTAREKFISPVCAKKMLEVYESLLKK